MNRKEKIVIVGGVAGGATAAARIRRLNEGAEIVVFERTGYVSYANCGLPYYIGGVITNKNALTLQTPESFRIRYNVTMKVRHEVTAIHPEQKTVSVRDLESKETWEEPYDKLLLAPGARPLVPDMPGTDLDEVFTLRTVEDTFRIKEYIDSHNPKTAVLCGGGFIGLELAENLAEAGLSVTIVQRPDQVLKILDPEMAAFLHARLRSAGIRLVLGDSVVSLRKDGELLQAELKSGGILAADIAVLALGVSPESDLAKNAGLALGEKGSILVNERMETSVKDIYAVGDAVQIVQAVTGMKTLVPLAGPANKQARIAADNICGVDSTYPGSLSTCVVKVFDMTAAATGINEKTAKALGLRCDKIFLSPPNHAGYYPGGSAMTIKVLFDPEEDRLLGAQIVGFDGVDKRIDVFAAALSCGAKASSLADLDLAYAPPYSSAKDPVNMAGFMIDNILDGRLKQFFYEDIPALREDKGVTLLDTRTPGEYARGHADGFINVPLDGLRDHLDELPKDKPVYVMCQTGIRSYIACSLLTAYGFTCYNFSGGYRLYQTLHAEEQAAKETWPCGMDK